MEQLLNPENLRLPFISTLSAILGYFTPTIGFIFALLIMFTFNIWCGMRADGVGIKRCENFSFKKFGNALFELLFYLLIIEVIFSVMAQCGDKEAALLAIKTLTYVFMYVYLQNAFKNLIQAYPKNKAFRIIYHVIRLEFIEAMPGKVQEIIDQYDEEEKKEEEAKKAAKEVRKAARAARTKAKATTNKKE